MSSMSRHTVNGITLNSKFQHKQLCSGHNTDTAWIDTDEILSRTIFCQFCSNVVCLAVNVLTQHETCKFPVGTQRCRHERKCTKCGRYLHLWLVCVNLCNRLKFPFPSLDIYCLLGRACLCRSWNVIKTRWSRTNARSMRRMSDQNIMIKTEDYNNTRPVWLWGNFSFFLYHCHHRQPSEMRNRNWDTSQFLLSKWAYHVLLLVIRYKCKLRQNPVT